MNLDSVHDEYLTRAKFEVVARFRLDRETEAYSNYKKTSDGKEEVCTSCRFDVNTLLENLAELEKGDGDAEAWVSRKMSEGLEIEHSFHWQCNDIKLEDRYGCNVWTDQSVIRDGFKVSRVSVPTSRGSLERGEKLRRRVTFTGMMVHFSGQGGVDDVTGHAVMNMIAQLVTMILLAGMVISFLTFGVLGGSGRRCARAFDAYPEALHAELHKVVRMKKQACPELEGLTDDRLHQRIQEDVQILCGLDFNDQNHGKQIQHAVETLKKHQGSMAESAKEMGVDLNVSDQTMSHLTEALRTGTTTMEGKDSVDNDDDERSVQTGVSQETV